MSETDYRADLYRTYEVGNEQLDEALFQEKVAYFRHRVGPYLSGDKQAVIGDLACGVGEFLWLARSLGYSNATGLDLSETQLAHARRMGIENVRQESLFDHLEANQSKYDFLLLSHVVEHLTKNELLQCMRLCRAGLKPGGRVVLMTPNAASPLGFIYAVSDFTHELLLSATSLSQVGKAAGLRTVHIGGTVPRGRVKSLAWSAMRPAIAAVFGDRRLPYGRVVEPELIGVFERAE